jgi:hypothetical protein
VTAQKMPGAKLVRLVERVRHVIGRVPQRSVPPAGAMMEMILGAWRAQGIAVAAELKVADALANGPLVQVAARERTADEYRKLYGQAGFQMTRVVSAAGPISIVEGKAV